MFIESRLPLTFRPLQVTIARPESCRSLCRCVMAGKAPFPDSLLTGKLAGKPSIVRRVQR